MPSYTYKCNKCKKESVHYIPIQDRNKLLKCKCKGSLKRQVDSFSFILKGSGWARDGYSNKNQ